MTEFIASPSRLFLVGKVGAIVARLALWTLALAWVVLILVWGGLHLLIVPGIAEFRPLLEQQASKAIGATVRIGALSVKSSGLIPAFELNDVVLLDAQGREALRLPSVVVALSPRSALGLGFEQLYIDRPVLDMRRSADGQIWIAGFALPRTDSGDSRGLDWVFSQTEIVIHQGRVTWTDATRDAPPLTLTDVDGVLRNRHSEHSMRLDVSPPPEWGERLSVTAIFEQSLLARSAGRWREWEGHLYADFAQIDLARLRPYADWGVNVEQGAGAMRAWVDVRHGEVTGATADVALRQVNASIDPRLEPLALQGVTGRLGARVLDGGKEVSTEGLQFDTQDGLHWPGGNVRVTMFDGDARAPAHGELVADRLDLAAMVEIAGRLPLGEGVHSALSSLAPKGVIERVQGSWTGSADKLVRYAAKGRVVNLDLAAETHEVGAARPGLKGADIDFDFNQSGGKAGFALRNGRLDFPGIFEEPQLLFNALSGEVQWKQDGAQISVTVPSLRFSNADAEGEAQIRWQTGDIHPFPGVLDLQANLSRADGARVHRYLPLPLPKDVREYVHNAIPFGSATGVKFKVKGKLQDFPFENARQGDFRISANLKDVTYDYAPLSVLAKDSPPWPALTHASGELVIDRNVLQVKLARSNLAGGPGLRVGKVEGVVNSLYDGATVEVTADIQGPLAEGLAVVNASPLGALTGGALTHATANGSADYRFKLAFPIAAVERATVQGAVTLAANDIQITADTPRLSRTRGTIAFSETGFSVSGGQARALGGDVRIEGGLSVAASNTVSGTKTPPPSPVLRLQGTATADGLRQARELGIAARLAQYASGATAYSATLGLRAGMPELLISSNLTGLALRLPAPFTKTAESPLALRLENSVLRTAPKSGSTGLVATQDQLLFDVGRLVNIAYVRDITGSEARVLRGSIAVGLAADESAPLPESGVLANINANSVDLDAWSDVLSQASGAELSPGTLATPAVSPGMAYLPTTMAMRARELTLGGRKLNHVIVGAGREGLLWRANVDASELNGYVEYRQPSGPTPGRLFGRLARLVVAPSTAQDVETILDEQPASIPALDIVVEDFELRGKKLGRVEIDAVNLSAGATGAAREWRLNRFNITTPEAVLTANGNWTNINAQGARAGPRNIKDRRRTVLNFKLAISDAGELLDRFGMKGVIRKGDGKIEGQVAWLGSPITLDYPSLGGNFNINVESGQFLKADPGIAKLLGVLSLQSLPRRLVLDFRDVFSEGFAFDFLHGDVMIEQGIARTNNLQMKGVNAAVLMEGQADIAKETQNIKVVVIPEINAGSASLIASIVNPVVGLSTFLAQIILRRPLMEAATQQFLIDGTWVDPRVTKIDYKTGKPEDSK